MKCLQWQYKPHCKQRRNWVSLMKHLKNSWVIHQRLKIGGWWTQWSYHGFWTQLNCPFVHKSYMSSWIKICGMIWRNNFQLLMDQEFINWKLKSLTASRIGRMLWITSEDWRNYGMNLQIMRESLCVSAQVASKRSRRNWWSDKKRNELISLWWDLRKKYIGCWRWGGQMIEAQCCVAITRVVKSMERGCTQAWV